MKKYIYACLAVMILLQGCKKDDDVYTPGSSDGAAISSIIKLDNKNTADIPADQATTATINVQVPSDALAANRVITLATTLGKFTNGQKTSSVTADAYGKAQFDVTSADVGTAVITVTSKTYAITTTLKFVPAMPDDMLLTSDKYQMDPAASATITARLVRNPQNGTVTDPVKVYFTVTGGSGTALNIPEFAYSASGSATATLSNPFMALGTYTVTATTSNQKGEAVKKTMTIVIK